MEDHFTGKALLSNSREVKPSAQILGSAASLR
jgi:hypothetical protein